MFPSCYLTFLDWWVSFLSSLLPRVTLGPEAHRLLAAIQWETVKSTECSTSLVIPGLSKCSFFLRDRTALSLPSLRRNPSNNLKTYFRGQDTTRHSLSLFPRAALFLTIMPQGIDFPHRKQLI